MARREHVEETRPIPELVNTLAAALDFKQPGRGVRNDAFTDWARDWRDQKLASAVWRHQRHTGESLEVSVAEIAARHEVSDTTVRRAWDAWRAFLADERATRKE